MDDTFMSIEQWKEASDNGEIRWITLPKVGGNPNLTVDAKIEYKGNKYHAKYWIGDKKVRLIPEEQE